MKKWYSIVSRADAKAVDVAVYDEIGGWGVSAKSFRDEFVAAAGKDLAVNLRINSPGGSIFEGLAIYNLIKAHPGKITVHIDGLAASMASILAMAGDEIVMPENALMMIHNPRGTVFGDSDVVRDFAELMDKVKDNMVSIYAGKTGLSDGVIGQAMNDETWYTGAEAVQLGFADRLVKPVRLAATADLGNFKYIPERISSQFTRWRNPPAETAGNDVSGVLESLRALGAVLSSVNKSGE